ncbi:Di-copper centre-containing protein [Lophium mytilinum]|uniref:Di-copper centre-containing protein n=1 Tax=Lophium mytilinum TaxID=390894 RepID=A0A6A6QQ52_9PEZI|nr:Di-copper centre-containing protein [Lophium mytilinum]
MRFFNLVAVASVLFSTSNAAPLEERTASSYAGHVDALAAQGFFNLAFYTATQGLPSQKCNLQNVAVRREWSTLASTEKKSYISAVKCLSKKPAITSTELVPGVRSRYDDFVATHINQTLAIHGTGNFLSWHRYFVWAYEQALRRECGYTGYQPYWNWGKYADDPLSSPIFDGSDSSMSGNGAYVKHNASCIPSDSLCEISLPTGTGGGCITSGPFKDFSVNLGPVAPALSYVEPNPGTFGMGYNPRCIRRDISAYAASHWTKDADTASLILNNPDPYWFQTNMQGNFPAGFLGVHTGGHFTNGGDPGGDLFVSPGDPVFWLHHGMIDRVWWTWQNLDVEKRKTAISGTLTVNNSPPSRNATLDDFIDLGINAGPIKIRDAMSTIAGPFCYVYA